MGSLRQSGHYDGTRNWDVSQPIAHYWNMDPDTGSVAQYLADAEKRKAAFDCIIDEFKKAADVPVTLTPACVKPKESALRKLWDKTNRFPGAPEMIRDYLRAAAEVPHISRDSVFHLDRLIDVVVAHPATIGYKDKYWMPNPQTGHRAFQAHIDVDGHAAEFKIEYGGMRRANTETESLRSFERALRNVGAGNDNPADKHKMITQAESAIKATRDLRKIVHDVCAEACGLNRLLDPTLSEIHKTYSTEEVRSMFKMRRNNPFGRQLHKKQPALLESLPRLGQYMH